MQIEDKARVDARIAGAFRVAADATGTSFDRLARTAAQESDLRPDLASTTSSAQGLFQFVDQTWLELIRKEGPSVGLGRLADQITSDGKGGLTVADPKEKAKILALKTDPLVASVMAGRFTEANTRILSTSLGRAPSEAEVTAAHVLGASGAVRLVRLAESDPNSTASISFPKAAAANPGLFYGKDGRPRSVSDLLAGFGTTSADTAQRISEAHAAAASTPTRKLDSTALAAMIRAQAAAATATQGVGGTGTDAATAARFARSALTEKSLPGASTEIVPPSGARVDGWRAKASKDAFSLLMRSDGQALTADAATAADPTATADATASPPIRFAAGGSPSRIGGAAGGIPFVDPNQPMRLVGDAGARPAISGAPVGARPSRLMSAAASGAPAMPLPMVDGGTVVRPVRVTTATVGAATSTDDGTATSGLVAAGAARVKTVSIAPAPAAGSTPRPLLPPVPGDAAEPTMPSLAGATAATSGAPTAARANRPLDLLALQRRAQTTTGTTR